ncbi:MAG: hypothetical protein AAB790_01080 [Patescibacteria group bacterium]
MFSQGTIIFDCVCDDIEKFLANPKVVLEKSYDFLAVVWVYPNTILQPDKFETFEKVSNSYPEASAFFANVEYDDTPTAIPFPRSRYFNEASTYAGCLCTPSRREFQMVFFLVPSEKTLPFQSTGGFSYTKARVALAGPRNIYVFQEARSVGCQHRERQGADNSKRPQEYLLHPYAFTLCAGL